MNIDNQIHPSQESIIELLTNHPKDQALVMVNFLRYRNQTESGVESGEDAYARYGKNALPYLKKAGARILWRGRVTNMVIGKPENKPHEILLVQYPSVQHFLDMAMSKEYALISQDRTIALEYGGLISTTTMMGDLY